MESWNHGISHWIPFKDLKASKPVEFDEYAIANRISEYPFEWWFRQVLQMKKKIIAKANKKKTRLPKNVEEALEPDRLNGNEF